MLCQYKKMYLRIKNECKPTLWNIDFKMQVAYTYEKSRRQSEPTRSWSSIALNINVCFVALPFQEDPGPAAERLNDTDYLFGKPHETADW